MRIILAIASACLFSAAPSGPALAQSNAAAPVKVIDATALAKGTVVISAPGAYRLSGDMIASNLANGEPLIRITTDNVTLDLDGRTIGMATSASSTENAGIEIRSVSNITIRNGAFSELSGAGIYVECDVDTVARRCVNFNFSDLAMRNVGKRGAYGDLGNVFVRPFSGGVVMFGRSTTVPAVGGAWDNSIAGVHVSRVTIRNDVKHLFADTPPAGGQNGFTFISVSDLSVEDTAIAGMASNDAAACIFLGRIKGAILRRLDCRDATGDRNANGLDSMANVASPPAIKKNFDVVLEDSSFSNILATGPRANEALGIELNGEKYSFNRITVTDVKNDNTTAIGNRAIGIQINQNGSSNETSRITDCIVRNVTHHGSSRESRAGGVSIEASPPVVVSRCRIANIVNHGGGPNAIKAFGYRVEPGTKKIIFEDNSVEGVATPSVTHGEGGNSGYAAGFALVNAYAEMSRNSVTRAPFGVFARDLNTNSRITDNVLRCNAIGIADTGVSTPYARNQLLYNAFATRPAELLTGTENKILAGNSNDCPAAR